MGGKMGEFVMRVILLQKVNKDCKQKYAKENFGLKTGPIHVKISKPQCLCDIVHNANLQTNLKFCQKFADCLDQKIEVNQVKHSLG